MEPLSSVILPNGLFDSRILDQLPGDSVASLRASSSSDAYLDTLAVAALDITSDVHLTARISALYEPVFVDLAARWLSLSRERPDEFSLRVVSAFSRILPFAEYLRSFAQEAIRPEKGPVDVTTLGDDSKFHYLLALFRLLSLDPEFFSAAVVPNTLLSLFHHEQAVIRYLAIRCFTLHVRAADAATQDIMNRYTGTGAIEGPWEDRTIDYRFLSLWEERRWMNIEDDLQKVRDARDDQVFRDWIYQLRHVLNARTAEVGGVIVPATRARAPDSADAVSLVRTPTVSSNLQNLGHALLSNDPILLCGLPGSGKTTLVNSAASAVGQSKSMITLHLNEQTDSKSLLGVYSTSAQVGSFTWQPGVLTQAAKEGRWVLIEDLDRAPAEVLGLILPLIEKRELVIPSRKETIQCAEGFRVLATMRTMINTRGEENVPGTNMLGNRLWKRIPVKNLPLSEVEVIIREKFPLLSARTTTIIAMFERIGNLVHGDLARKSLQGRTPGLRDLIKFCSRVQRRLELIGCVTGNEPVPESLDNKVFMDAVDCFASYLPVGVSKDTLCGVIAQELQLSPQRSHFCLNEQTPKYEDATDKLTVGREVCRKRKLLGRKAGAKKGIFAPTRPSLRTMEQIASALQLAEPLLLVGETGIGKTAVIQQLASLLNQRLTVVNLSQQSETTDLLGGFKPVNLRTLAVPLVDEFNELFDVTFSAKKNQKFLNSVKKAVTNGNWPRLLTFLKEAIKMASSVFAKKTAKHNQDAGDEGQEQPSKKRRFDEPKYVALREKWEAFERDLREFEARSAQGDSGFAFAFVQGKIVKALRDGDWVLLDEINLASPDTLESIASLLHHGADGSPSVLLSEAGEVERIYGHPQFRIFGAMNPATDAGKRDLAPGLRSRFTEIYVNSPDTDIDDLIGLIDAYLGPLTASDLTASAALAQLYLETKQLNIQNRLTDGAGQKPHFSIRTLVRTLVYVRDQAQVYGLRRAIYEGFCMSFLTLLSKESEALIMPLLDKHIFSNLKNARSILSQTPKAPEDGQTYVRYKHYWMRQGAFPPEKQPHYIITPFIERNLMNLVRASSTRRFPILLQGPTSAGKTSMVEYLANVSGNRFVRINNHEHTDLQEYLGTYISGEDGRLVYQEGVLVEALRNGYWIVLDELNLAPTDVLEALNRLLDDNRELFLPESQEVVRPHPNFMLFATQNPAGLYGGRKILSRAFRNRFLELHFDDIPEDELEYILRERSQIAPSFCTRIVSVYKRLSLLRQSSRLFEQRNSFATLRDLFRWALRKADDREQLAINGFMLLAERVRNSHEREAVKKVIEEVMKVKLDLNIIYSAANLDSRLQQAGLALPTGIIWTPAMRRVFLLVSHAIENNEPVLLVGETGCGKTQICQAIAEAYRRHLYVINAHVNLETGDLIGAQRPVRNRAAIESQLMSDLTNVLSQQAPLENLLSQFSKLEPQQLEQMDHEVLDRIRTNAIKAKSLFQWSNGSLITAMESGQHFLLDEISLADDSVLERLNSVLEPHRSILLAEKGPVDSMIVAKHGFQFLATMNPGGDYGKRELSAALRNRLTEIWVPQLSEADDILPILERKLERSGPKVPEAMLAFAKWFKARFQGSSTGSMSIRDLLSWVNFVNTCNMLDLNAALIHGAALVYIDTLGANPSALLAASTGSLENDRMESLKKLGELFSFNAVIIYYQHAELSVGSDSMKIGPFSLQLGNNSMEDPAFALDAPTTLSNALRIARGLQSAKPILLEGSPGVGKTTLVATLAQVLGKPLTRINLSEQTDLTDLFGSDVPVEGSEMGNFAWSDAPFLRALQNGGWVLLDEMNLASQSVLEGLNSCLDHRQEVYIAELDQTFRRHEDFVLFAAQNPHHQGGGRKGLPASFVNRFTVVYADSFSDHDLKMICRKISPAAPQKEIDNMVGFISVLNLAINERRMGLVGGPWEINLRDISRWLKLLEKTQVRVQPYQFLDVVISHRFRTAGDRKEIFRRYNDVFSDAPDPKSYFHNLGINHLQVGLGMLQRNRLLQDAYDSKTQICKHELAIMESLILCIEQGWPSILVGPSGCGKTRMLRKLAAINGSKLVELSLNADTDTMDLIGGFEQADNQRHVLVFMEGLVNFIRERILECLATSQEDLALDLVRLLGIVHEKPFGLDIISELLARVAAHTGSQDYEHVSQKCASLYETSTASSRIGFEWTEGMFIQAIQQGHWVVLDNANLCNASVLDRLNSLMEPNGSLIISEQRTSDGSARIVTPHPNFRLFLTLDPRHGELSRAMRNRAIEICFLAEEQPVLSVPSSIVYGTESSIYRMRPCHDLALNKVVSEEPQFTFEVMLDHISHVDIGSINMSTKNECLFGSSQTYEYPQTMERYSSLNTSCYKPVQVFTADSDVIEASLQPVVNLLSCFLTNNHWQPLNLLVNEPRLQADFLESDKDRIMALMKLQELQLDVHKFHQTLVSVSEGAFVKKPSEMTRLERSMASGRIASLKKDSTHVVSSFLLHCCQAISDWIQSAAQSDIGETVSVPRFILNFAWDLFKLLQKPVFDEGIFQAYLQTTWAWIVKHRDVQTKLMKFFSCSLGTFNSDWGLSTGKSMQRLWSEWRPVTPNGPSQLLSLSKLQSISAKFDKISLNTRLPLERLAQLRSSLSESQRAILLGATGDELIQNLDTVISDLEHHILGLNTVSGPYFSEEFEALCQYNSMSGTSHSALSEVMHLLAGRPSRLPEFSNLGNPVPSLLSTLSSFAGFKSPHRKCLALQGTLPISTIGKILSVEDVPLKAMDLLEAETEALSRAISSSTAVISSSQVLFLQKALKSLLSELITSHKDVFTPDSFAMTLSQLQDMLDAQPLRLQASSDYDDQPYAHHLAQVFATCHESISNLSVLDSDCISRSGVACIQLAVACLRLFIPDKPLDPSLNLVVCREQFESRLLEKTRRMESLRSFEKRFTGCDTNLRIRTVQNELRLLGDFPPEPPVVRPQPSQLIELQGEFSNILNTVLISDLDQPLSSSFSSAELLRKNIKQVCHRLTNNYGAYGDIVALAVQFLELLDLGLSLIQQPNGVSDTSSKYLQEISKITPLLSYSSLSVANFDKSVSGPQISHNVELYVHRISVLSVLQNADSTVLEQQNYRRVLRENLNRLYAIWKEKLSADQEKEAERSKTYRYRGNFEDEEQVDADELHRLFPTYEAEGDADAPDSRSTALDVSSLAQRLFNAVKALFTKTDIELQVRQVIRDSFHLVGSVLRKSSLPFRHSEPSTYLPGVLLLLAEKNSTQGSLYNFYTDMNTLEIKKLAALVEKIQLRFSELQKLWSEHAALSDVLTCCSEIYDFRHREPLAKFITKAEKLHGLVYLWQLVASKQYSAANLYDDLTSISDGRSSSHIPVWRRNADSI
ncbi:hypothetical protein KEM56_004066 [Ascosphaera pollenicola]|nr:hypothetical protein KEM56_004066 [Ascosphaera pollenicola]